MPSTSTTGPATRFLMVGMNTIRYERNLRQASHRRPQDRRVPAGPPGPAGAPDRPQRRRRAGGHGPRADEPHPADHRARSCWPLPSPRVTTWPGRDGRPATASTTSGPRTTFAFLGIGTTTFGNMDREHGPAAGMIGFHVPERLSVSGCEALRDETPPGPLAGRDAQVRADRHPATWAGPTRGSSRTGSARSSCARSGQAAGAGVGRTALLVIATNAHGQAKCLPVPVSKCAV